MLHFNFSVRMFSAGVACSASLEFWLNFGNMDLWAYMCIYSHRKAEYVLLCVYMCAWACVLILASCWSSWWRAITFSLVQLHWLWVWNTAAPRSPNTDRIGPKRPPLLPLYSPLSLPCHPSLPLLDPLPPTKCLLLHLSLSLSLDSLLHCFFPPMLGIDFTAQFWTTVDYRLMFSY